MTSQFHVSHCTDSHIRWKRRKNSRMQHPLLCGVTSGFTILTTASTTQGGKFLQWRAGVNESREENLLRCSARPCARQIGRSQGLHTTYTQERTHTHRTETNAGRQACTHTNTQSYIHAHLTYINISL